jgi:hypothetical protein
MAARIDSVLGRVGIWKPARWGLSFPALEWQAPSVGLTSYCMESKVLLPLNVLHQTGTYVKSHVGRCGGATVVGVGEMKSIKRTKELSRLLLR